MRNRGGRSGRPGQRPRDFRVQKGAAAEAEDKLLYSVVGGGRLPCRPPGNPLRDSVVDRTADELACVSVYGVLACGSVYDFDILLSRGVYRSVLGYSASYGILQECQDKDSFG